MHATRSAEHKLKKVRKFVCLCVGFILFIRAHIMRFLVRIYSLYIFLSIYKTFIEWLFVCSYVYVV